VAAKEATKVAVRAAGRGWAVVARAVVARAVDTAV